MLDVVREVARQTGPFSSVSLDATRTDETAAEEIDKRFRAQAERLTERGAPAEDIDSLREVLTSLPDRGGPLTRLAVARDGAVLLDLVLPGDPPRDECVFGPAPHLLPVVRASQQPTPYLVIDVDRAGADIDVVGPLGAATWSEEVTGTEDLLHKVRSGGWSHRRMQQRVQDSWDRNAGEVADVVNRLAARADAVAVLLGGDPYAVSALTDALDGATRELVWRIESGGRAAGVHEWAHRDAIDRALTQLAETRRTEALDAFAAAEARQQEAVQGLTAVVDSLRRGQVSTVLLHDDPTSTATLWSGPDPLQIGADRDEVAAMGVDGPQRIRADAILVRAAVVSEADILLVNDDDVDLTDGIGAVLRWSDLSTPHDAAPSMPDH